MAFKKRKPAPRLNNQIRSYWMGVGMAINNKGETLKYSNGKYGKFVRDGYLTQSLVKSIGKFK